MIFIGNRYEITDRPVYIEENKLYNAYDSEKKIDVKIKIIEKILENLEIKTGVLGNEAGVKGAVALFI